MSVLLVRARGALGEKIARRLLAQGDEVRVIEAVSELAGGWSELGVHVARGDDGDADLVERAAQNVRTIVMLDDEAGPLREIIGEVVTGARAARVDRLVYVAARPDPPVVEALRSASVEYVVLATKSKGILGKTVAADRIAEAVDAADDIAGVPRLEIDLTDPASLGELGLGE